MTPSLHHILKKKKSYNNNRKRRRKLRRENNISIREGLVFTSSCRYTPATPEKEDVMGHHQVLSYYQDNYQ